MTLGDLGLLWLFFRWRVLGSGVRFRIWGFRFLVCGEVRVQNGWFRVYLLDLGSAGSAVLSGYFFGCRVAASGLPIGSIVVPVWDYLIGV